MTEKERFEKESKVLENLEKAQEEHFESLHSKELMHISKNFTDKEQQDVCRVMNSRILEQELSRRNELVTKIVDDVFLVIDTYRNNPYESTLSKKEEFIAKIKEAIKA